MIIGVLDNSSEIEKNDGSTEIPELAKVFMTNQIINYLVLVNLLFAITHRLYS